jgi:hypothetical protein
MNLTRIWIGAGALAIVAVLAGGWFLGVSPLLTQASTNDADRASVLALNQAQEAQLVVLADQTKKWESIEKDRARLQSAIPADPRMPALVGEISSLAAAAGVQITSFSTSDAQLLGGAATEAPASDPAAAAAPADAAAAATTADGAAAPAAPTRSGLVAVPVELAASGSTDALLGFLSGLQHGERLMLVSGMNLAGSDSGAEQSLTVSGYVFVLPAT